MISVKDDIATADTQRYIGHINNPIKDLESQFDNALTVEIYDWMIVVVVVVVNFIKHQNRAITGERVAARAAPSYQYAMVLVIIT